MLNNLHKFQRKIPLKTISVCTETIEILNRSQILLNLNFLLIILSEKLMVNFYVNKLL